MNVLLEPVAASTAYLNGKVEAIRAATAGAPPVTIRPRLVLPLDRFEGAQHFRTGYETTIANFSHPAKMPVPVFSKTTMQCRLHR